MTYGDSGALCPPTHVKQGCHHIPPLENLTAPSEKTNLKISKHKPLFKPFLPFLQESWGNEHLAIAFPQGQTLQKRRKTSN
jgi:hypothetical protein